MPRETYCSKCQGMVNGNGCELEACEVNDGKGFKNKQEREKATEKKEVAASAKG